jgi:transcriptional/translational regulatory protein YebC/TACO1
LSAKCDDELVMEIALEAGAEDIVSNDDGSTDVLTKLETFGVIQDALVAKQLVPETAEMTMLAATEVELDLSTAQTLLKLIEHMEELDDVQNVYSNANISDEIAAQL